MKRIFLSWGYKAMLLCGMAFFSCDKTDLQPSRMCSITAVPLGFMADSITFEEGSGYRLNCPAFLADSMAGLVAAIVRQRGHYASHVTAHYSREEFNGVPMVQFDLIIGSTTDHPHSIIIHGLLWRKECPF